MKALLGLERYGEVLVTELGGRKRDRKKVIMDSLERSYREGSLAVGQMSDDELLEMLLRGNQIGEN